MKKVLRYTFLISALVFGISSSYSQCATDVPAVERQALIDLYNATNGASWTNNTNWNTTACVSDWYGVTVVNNVVTELDLRSNNLSGAIPTSIDDLSNLEDLNLFDNQINGSIPAEIGNLTDLTGLNLSKNTLTGAILSELGNLINLTYLSLHDNQLTGSIPTQLGNLTGLIQLYLHDNQLTGAIPSQLGNLINVTDFRIYNNQLTGSIPSELGNLVNLIQIYLYNNQLTGSIPNELNSLVNLNTIHFANNQLSGNIPDWVFNLSASGNIDIYLYGNQLTGTLPATINSPNLRRLQLNNNQLSGTIPTTWTNLPNLERLYLSYNNLSGSIPGEIGNLTGLTQLWLNNNSLSGSIPIEIGNLTGLTHLYLHNNTLSGTIPSQIGSLTNLTRLNLSDNQLTGAIPTQIGSLTGLTALYMEKNDLSGNIPPEIGALTSLIFLNLSENQLTGSIPTELGNLSSLVHLYIQDNGLSGGIPSAISSISSLSILSFGNNAFIFSDFENEHTTYISNLSGYTYSPQAKVDQVETPSAVEGTSYTFTTSLSSANNSYQWYKDGVAINGATSKDYTINSLALSDAGVYHVVATNSVVTGLTLTRNDITLTVTADTCGVSTSERDALIALYNATDGANWTNNTNWNTSAPVCDWYGVTATNGNVTHLNLSGNNLNGSLVAELEDLTSIEYIHFDNNSLSGSIPSEFSNLSNLIEIHLDNNQLSGTIPATSSSTGLTHFHFNDNAYVFSDFEALHPAAEAILVSYIYSPQAKVDQVETPLAVEGTSYTFTTSLSSANNSYQWYKDGVAINGATSKDYTINNLALTDAGVYHVVTNNSIITGLTLTRHDITLTVTAACGVPTSERDALIALYNATDGANWTNNTNWNTSAPVCDWFGVTASSGNVTVLNLNNNNLAGTIPGSIGDLINLNNLHLSSNQLTGSIPIELGSIASLERLELNSNQLSGSIPSELGGLVNLTNLDLGINQLTGSIPIEITNLINMVSLGLHSNQLTGTIPIGLGTLTDLVNLRLNGNQLTGTIPSDIGTLSNLVRFYLYNNALTGSVPTSFSGLTNIRYLYLYNNQLSGTIPSALSGIASLDDFRFYNNAFIFSDFENEHTTYTSNLTTYSYSPQAKVDQVETPTAFEGTSHTFTTSLSSANNSYQWYKDGVAINGAASKDYTINSLALNDAGVYHVVATNSIITGLTLTRHDITLTVTADTCGVPTSERDALIALYTATDGANWTNNTNWNTSAPVCDWYGVTVENGHVTKLVLDSNGLKNNIPLDIQYLTYLEELDLDRNQLDGNIPTELQYLTSLEVLSLFANKLTGSIPTELGQLTNLKHLDLGNNVSFPIEGGEIIIEGLLTGSIPSQLGILPNLEFFSVYANNNLSGDIPSTFSTIATLDTLYFGYNSFIFSDFETEHPDYVANLAIYDYSPQAKVDQEETIFVAIGADSAPLTTSLSAPGNTYQWQFSSDGGNTYTDILNATGHDYIITNASAADQGLYRLIANNTVVTGLTLERYPITVVVGNSNSFCTTVYDEDITIAHLVPNGSNTLWYTDETGGDPLNSDTEIVIEANDLGGVAYWWDDPTDNIPTRTISTVYIDTKTPEGDTEQWFSIQASPAATIADIEVYNDDNPVYWYATDSSTTPMDVNTVLVDGVTYYASSCDSGDDTCSCRLPVTVNVILLPPKGDSLQHLCETSTLNDMVLEVESGLSVVWYEAICFSIGQGVTSTYVCGPQLDGSTQLVDGKTYYAVQKDNNDVESSGYLSVMVELASVAPPVVDENETTQVFYDTQSPTISFLRVNGRDIIWYSQPTGGTAYAANYPLEDNTIYYAEHVFGNCPSTSRTAVTVSIIPEPDEPLYGCEMFRPELGQHYVIDAWVNEREVTVGTSEIIPFNNSPESELLVALLNHLKNRLMSEDKNLHDIPDEYEPEFTAEEVQHDLGPLMAYIEGLSASEQKLIVYDFTPVNDSYGRAIGFSFYLSAAARGTNTNQFIYKTPTFTYTVPKLTENGVTEDPREEHYPLLDSKTVTPNEHLNFTNVDVSNGVFTMHADFNHDGQTESQTSALSNSGLVKSDITINTYSEVAFQATPDYTNTSIEISFVDEAGNAINTPITYNTHGEIIDKWQKITGDFTIPNNAGRLIISLRNDDENKVAYFDDLRIYPYEGNIKTFVYHPENQRLMSELDENNYATFYEYDSEGGLIRVKKETVKGTYTIQETRSGNVKAAN